MKPRGIHPSGSLLVCLLSLFLITAGISRYIETDSGNILIHDIEVESFEGYLYGARLFRPLQASSMNPRPSVLIFPGARGTHLTGDHLAMEFARRGFVVLTIEAAPRGFSGPQPTEEPENPVDSAYNFLTTRFFTDPVRSGLITFYDGTETALRAEHYTDFTSAIFVAPPNNLINTADRKDPALLLTAQYETDPDYRIETDSLTETMNISSAHAGMIFHSRAIAAMLEQFHEDLAIPNDSPFWFSSAKQFAQLLLILRALLLILLYGICICMSALLTQKSPSTIRMIAGILIPLCFFMFMDEVMNFFLISVRLGTPYHYLKPVSQLLPGLSPWICILSAAGALLCAIPIKRSGSLYLIDILAAGGVLFCLFGFLPILFSGTSGWEMLGITQHREMISLFTVFACLYCLLLRIPSHYRASIISASVLTGLMYFLTFSSF